MLELLKENLKQRGASNPAVVFILYQIIHYMETRG